MNVSICKCRKCGRYHVFKKYEVRDAHVCECGERIERWTHEIPECEVRGAPNEPYGEASTARQNHRKPQYPTTIEMDCKTTESFNETLDKQIEAHQLTQPVIITDKTKALLFRSNRNLSDKEITKLKTDLVKGLGVKCIILDKDIIELTAVIE